uniref:Uncharacterized protein n=1 Tax=Arundo donax TaxID=35708 RepID=A0A0A9GFT9_ARUDO
MWFLHSLHIMLLKQRQTVLSRFCVLPEMLHAMFGAASSKTLMKASCQGLAMFFMRMK